MASLRSGDIGSDGSIKAVTKKKDKRRRAIDGMGGGNGSAARERL
jgi:hypothetical protein